MSTAPNNLLDRLDEHLQSQLRFEDRKRDFDMNDAPEMESLTPFPSLRAALEWLDKRVGRSWHRADARAMRSQRGHRLLARISITAGTSAIILSIVQLALKKPWTHIAAWFEAVAVLAGMIAVVLGLVAKFNRRWLKGRHRAEMLRMLKFQALGRHELWCNNLPAWQLWVEGQLKALRQFRVFSKVEHWATTGEIEPLVSPAFDCMTMPELVAPLTTYYRHKRLAFQSRFFEERSLDCRRKMRGWRHVSLYVFFTSVLFVLAHYAAGHLAGRASPAMRGSWEDVALWCVVGAAVVPVFGFGVRAWFAAFEVPRSAILFEAKHRALVRAETQLRQDANDPIATFRHIAQNEHFLEHEHREWLRLLLDTEWFL